MSTYLRKRPRGKGQTLVEYAMILVLVSIIAVAALRAIFSKGAAGPYEKVTNEGFGT